MNQEQGFSNLAYQMRNYCTQNNEEGGEEKRRVGSYSEENRSMVRGSSTFTNRIVHVATPRVGNHSHLHITINRSSISKDKIVVYLKIT